MWFTFFAWKMEKRKKMERNLYEIIAAWNAVGCVVQGDTHLNSVAESE